MRFAFGYEKTTNHIIGKSKYRIKIAIGPIIVPLPWNFTPKWLVRLAFPRDKNG